MPGSVSAFNWVLKLVAGVPKFLTYCCDCGGGGGGGGNAYRQARLCGSGALADVWMTTGDAASVPFFRYSGTCYYFDYSDATSTTPGTIIGAGSVTPEVSCAGCNPAPCTCPGVFSNTYAIAGYFNTMFDPSGCFGPGNSPNPPWNGTFSVAFGECRWTATHAGAVSINGRTLNSPATEISLNTFLCRWRVRIVVNIESGADVWVGDKPTGQTPLGVYTRVSGCSAGPASITIQ